MTDTLAYIDPALCTLCRKCVEVCPTHSIIETNFPPKKVKKPKEKTSKVAPAAKKETPVTESAVKPVMKAKVESNVEVKPEKPATNA